jgi:hypothetical protein
MEVKRVFIVLEMIEKFSLRGRVRHGCQSSLRVYPAGPRRTPWSRRSSEIFSRAVLSRSRLTFRRLAIRLNITCSHCSRPKGVARGFFAAPV